MPYEKQLEIKAAQVEDALRRLGHLDGFDDAADRPGGRAVALPQQARVLVRHRSGDRRADLRLPRAGVVGGHRRTSRTACCSPSAATQARREVLAWARAQGYTRLRPPHAARRAAQPRDPRGPAHRRAAGAAGRQRRRRGRARGRCTRRSRPTRLLVTEIETVGETTAGGDDRAGRRRADDRRGARRAALPALGGQAFFQTNTEMAEKLYAVAADVARAAGLGARLRPVLRHRHDRPVAGVARPARSGAWRSSRRRSPTRSDNAKANDISNAHFFAGDVRLALRELVEKAGRPDVIVVDPPRAGLSQKVVRRVLEASPKRIVYVSCNPTTLAPNAAQMVEAGYVLKTVQPVDMFPQTPHIECVALLERGGLGADWVAPLRTGGRRRQLARSALPVQHPQSDAHADRLAPSQPHADLGEWRAERGLRALPEASREVCGFASLRRPEGGEPVRARRIRTGASACRGALAGTSPP